jgi:hypothetical protein
MGKGRKQDQRVWVLMDNPSRGAVIINGVRYESLIAASDKLEIPWRDFERKLKTRKIVVTVPGN